MLAAALEVLVLVVAGGRGAQQDRVAGPRGGARLGDRGGEVAAPDERHRALEFAREPVGSLADQVRGLRARGERVAQPCERAALEAAAEDRVHAAGLERLDP